MDPRYAQLVTWFERTGGALLAFSGGVDSSLLLAAGADGLGAGLLAATARSPLHPAAELEQARSLAARLGIRHRLIDTAELEDPRVRDNPPERCYHCKRHILSALRELAAAEGLAAVVEGSNEDDLGQRRPGLRAIEELGVRSPYLELGLGKADIRALARERGLENWDRPAAACLASRIPFGRPLTIEVLSRVEAAEAALRDAGFGQLRVRDHGPLARIEIAPAEFERLLAVRQRLVRGLRAVGYTWVALDLLGYRCGAMDEGPSE